MRSGLRRALGPAELRLPTRRGSEGFRTGPSIARVGNYHLGGKDYYAVDRELADRTLCRAPIFSGLVRANRLFQHYAARLLAGQDGIRQFLDLGCGLPAQVNLAEAVREIDPDCRVACVDNDPMVLNHVRAVLTVDGRVGAVEADIREPGRVLRHPDLRKLIDLDRPVAVFLLDVLHFITDEENPRGIVRDLLRDLPPGSRLVLSHAEWTPELDAVSELYREAGIPFTPRGREEIAGLSRGLELDPPCPANLPFSYSGSEARMGNAVPLVGSIGRKI